MITTVTAIRVPVISRAEAAAGEACPAGLIPSEDKAA